MAARAKTQRRAAAADSGRRGPAQPQPAALASRLPWPQIAAALGLLVAVGIVLGPVFTDFWAHDSRWHETRIAQWHRGVEEGVWYPRFLHDIFWGYGGPSMIFYPPLPYFLTELFSQMGTAPDRALNYGLGLGLAAGSAALYALARPSLGRTAALVAAVAYTLVPYRLLDAYVRAAYAELLATAALPLLCLAARTLAERRGVRGAIWMALATGGLVLCHGATMVFGLPLALAYGLWCAPTGARRSAAAWLAGATLVGVGLSAFYMVPALAERGATQFNAALGRYHDYERHFLWIEQLFRTEWGFGNSQPGPNDGMSFQLGWVHALALLGAGFLAFWGRPELRREVRFWLAASAAAVFLTLESSHAVWRIVPLLPSIQFPWRLLLVTAMATSLFVGALARLGDSWRPLNQAGAVAALVALVVIAYRPFVAALPPRYTAEMFTPAGLQQQVGEDPIWLPAAARRSPPPGPRLAVASGTAKVEVLEDRTHRFSARVRADGPATVQPRIFMFAGWEARVDGAETTMRTDSATGAMQVDVPGGEHQIELRFGSTPARRLGAWISAASLVLAILAAALLPRALRRL